MRQDAVGKDQRSNLVRTVSDRVPDDRRDVSEPLEVGGELLVVDGREVDGEAGVAGEFGEAVRGVPVDDRHMALRAVPAFLLPVTGTAALSAGSRHCRGGEHS